MRLVLCNNTNSRVLYGTPTARNAWGDWRNNRDQNGNRIYVTVRLRRSAAVDTAVDDDSVVVRFQLYDRALLNPAAVIDTNRNPILFASVPRFENLVIRYPDRNGISSGLERGFYWYPMSLRSSLGEKREGKLELRKRLGTVMNGAFTRQVFDITAGMLRSLPAAAVDTSEWVEFSASVEFKRQSGLERGFATAIDTVTTDNPMYDKNANEETQTINTLSLDVFYAQTVDVDLDWIRFETPHARRILRDEYRYEIARAVHKFVAFFNDSIKALNAAHRILGIRVMEELDEEGWLVQRYMHRLLNGYAITEQHAHPNNRWRHAIGAADLDDAVALPTWHWNGTSNYHPTTETAAPFTHVGHGGNWFPESLARSLIQNSANITVVELQDRELQLWRNSVTNASLDLKFGMRRSFIDGAIAYDSTNTLRYKVAADTLTDLEVGNIRDSFSTWWNDLSAYEIAYGGYQGDEKQTTIISDSAAFMQLRDPRQSYASLLESKAFTANSDMPWQMGVDKARYQYVYRSDNNAHLFRPRPWLEQIWAYNRYDGVYDAVNGNQTLVKHESLRPHTAEEMRMSLASAMIFGAKGYMFFAGSAGHSFSTEANKKLLYERGMWNHNHEGSGLCTIVLDSTCTLSTCSTMASLDSLIWGDDALPSHFGDDLPIPYAAVADTGSALIPRFFRTLAGDRRGFIVSRKHMNSALVFKQHAVSNAWQLFDSVNATGLEPADLYVGLKSPRREILRHVARITAPATEPLRHTLRGGDSLNTTWSELLSLLSLRAWHGKGYRVLTVNDPASPTNYLSQYIDTSAITTRWPYREVPGFPTQDPATYTGTPDYESPDSAFFDVTILSDSAQVNGTFYVGVVNRRTNPVVVEHPTDSLQRRYRFVTPYEMETDTLLRRRPYQQVGAREITIPFRYSRPDGGVTHDVNRGLLHITEVGYPTIAGTLDTIIAEDQRLSLDYLPGQGRLFRVVPFLPSTSTDARGYLAFNTQTKLIAAPVYSVANGQLQTTGLVRYHMVYFRPDTLVPGDTTPTNLLWNVYYRRSKPLDPQKASDLTQANPWEPVEYQLNNQVHVRFNPNAPLPPDERTRIYKETATPQQLGSLDTPPTAPTRLDAGFPAITVTREPEAEVAMVRVVFACERDTVSELLCASALMIAECSFPDPPLQGSTIIAPAVGDARALVAVMTSTPQDCNSLTRYTIDDMARWGTPVISSALGRTYFAWSAKDEPIGTGSKPSTQAWFTNDNQLHAVEWLPDTSLHRFSMYPTLIPYANIAAGETTSSLAWTESWAIPDAPDRQTIRYTRLMTDSTGATLHYLPALSLIAYTAATDGQLTTQNATIDIGQWGEAGWMPSITRSVQHDTMVIDVPPADSSIYQFETVTWQSTVPAGLFSGPATSIIRRRHFLHTDVEQDDPHTTPETLHYSFNQLTRNGMFGLMHPTVNIGRHHGDTFPLLATHRNLAVRGGNRSDSATLTTYAALPWQKEVSYRARWLSDVHAWWTGTIHNSDAAVDQLPLLYGPYGYPRNLLHPVNNTKTNGMWPHIASRQDATTVPATYGMRRIQQTGTLNPPSIMFDVASFYKPEATQNVPAVYRGVSTASEELLLRLVDAQGRNVPQMFVEGRDGLTAQIILQTLTDMMPSVHELELGFELVGTLTEDIDIAIDEVDASQQVIRSIGIDPAALGLANGPVSGRLVLVNGEGRSYRVRLSSASAIVPCELLELAPQELTFGREPPKTTLMVDLGRGSTNGRTRCLLRPVPAADAFTVITPGGDAQDLTVTIAEPRGAVVRRLVLRSGSTVDISDLAVGIYSVTVTDAGGRLIQQMLPVIR